MPSKATSSRSQRTGWTLANPSVEVMSKIIDAMEFYCENLSKRMFSIFTTPSEAANKSDDPRYPEQQKLIRDVDNPKANFGVKSKSSPTSRGHLPQGRIDIIKEFKVQRAEYSLIPRQN